MKKADRVGTILKNNNLKITQSKIYCLAVQNNMDAFAV